MLRRSSLLLSAATLAGLSQAQAAPSVVTDIAPVHALVAQVMGDLGDPFLLVTPGVSPHDFSMRPSQARALQNADVVFQVGAGLTPWLEKALENLSGDAAILELSEVDGAVLRDTRELAVFASDHDDDDHDDHDDHDAHGHEDEHADHDDHAHDDHDDHDDHKGHDEHDEHAHEDHDDHAHDEHDDHDDHAEHAEHDHDDHEGHVDEHGHNHGGVDPHLWLDPVNASVWVGVIADALSAADPDNAATYAANAAAAQSALDDLQAEISAKLAPVQGRPFIVYHDAYQYFETRFDIPAAGSIAYSDAVDPSAARIQEIRDEVAEQGIVCVFAEPQYDAGLVSAVFGGSDADARVLDPLGADLEPGADLYPQLLNTLADTLQECLSPR